MDDTPGRIGTGAGRRPAGPGDELAGRADDNTRGYAESERADVDQRTREIRDEIEETRGEMTETIDAIQEKLKPRNIVQNATDRARSAATERVREMAETASQTTQQAIDYTRERASGMADNARENPIPLALIGIGTAWLLSRQSRRAARYDRDYGNYEQTWTRDEMIYGDDDGGIMGRLRHNPIPAALAGVGLTWLAFSRGNGGSYGRGERSSGEMANRGREESASMATRAREYSSSSTDPLRRMARRRQSQLQRMVQENPLLVGAGALMLGAAFGLAVPETETENELMGETRDNMVDRARATARDAATQVREAAGSVADAAKKLTGKAQP